MNKKEQIKMAQKWLHETFGKDEKYAMEEMTYSGKGLAYLRIFPNKKDGKELFFYDADALERQFVPIDDNNRCVFNLDFFAQNLSNEQEVRNLLLSFLGDPVYTYWFYEDETETLVYESLEELLEDQGLSVTPSMQDVSLLLTVDGFSLFIDGALIYAEEMPEEEFLEMPEV